MIQGWPLRLASCAYAQPFLIGWQISDHTRDQRWTDYETALNTCLQARDEQLSPAARLHHLEEGCERFFALRQQGDGHIATRLGCIRTLHDLGECTRALQEINALLQAMEWLADPIPRDLQISINRPFLAPTAECEQRPVVDDVGVWLQAGILEALEKNRAFSSWDHRELHLLQILAGNPNHSDEMERRQVLISMRLGISRSIAGDSRYARDGRGYRNAPIWQVLQQRY